MYHELQEAKYGKTWGAGVIIYLSHIEIVGPSASCSINCSEYSGFSEH
jgi:hypothetical protein